MGIIKEFKQFALKGNILDLAIAVIIGTAFGKIITAFTENIIMPVISLLLGKGGVAELSVVIGRTVFPVGVFLQAVIDFILIAFVLFLIVRTLNRVMRKQPPAPAATPEDILLLREIRDALKK